MAILIAVAPPSFPARPFPRSASTPHLPVRGGCDTPLPDRTCFRYRLIPSSSGRAAALPWVNAVQAGGVPTMPGWPVRWTRRAVLLLSSLPRRHLLQRLRSVLMSKRNPWRDVGNNCLQMEARGNCELESVSGAWDGSLWAHLKKPG
jgi:hypothetical protein